MVIVSATDDVSKSVEMSGAAAMDQPVVLPAASSRHDPLSTDPVVGLQDPSSSTPPKRPALEQQSGLKSLISSVAYF